MRRVVIAALAALFAIPSVVLLACSDDAATPDPGAADGSTSSTMPDASVDGPDCAVPDDGTFIHRPVATACRTDRPPGSTGPWKADECTNDAMCTNGTNGRCTVRDEYVSTDGESYHRACSYDACHQDSDCASGVCGCEIGPGGENLCLTNSDCRIDSDCATGRCVLSHPAPDSLQPGDRGDEIYPPGVNHPLTEARGYFCTTPLDNCCGIETGFCDYDYGDKHWAPGYGP